MTLPYPKLTVEVFNVSKYCAKQARELCHEKGILSVPERKERSTKDILLAFYESDHISHLLPGKKDCVTIRLPNKIKTIVQKRLLVANISEIHTSFKNEHLNKKIGFSNFALLQPKWCILVCATNTHNVCVCTYYQNVKFMLIAMNSPTDYKQIMKLCVCNLENDDCML